MLQGDHTWRVPALPAEIQGVRREVLRLVRTDHLSDTQASDVALAVSEAASNVVRHAFPGERTGSIDLRVHIAEEGVLVVVRDDGVGRGAPSDDPGAGLGLTIIEALADELVQRPVPGGGTELEMRFHAVGHPGRAG